MKVEKKLESFYILDWLLEAYHKKIGNLDFIFSKTGEFGSFFP
jgi:hypothetical protein